MPSVSLNFLFATVSPETDAKAAQEPLRSMDRLVNVFGRMFAVFRNQVLASTLLLCISMTFWLPGAVDAASIGAPPACAAVAHEASPLICLAAHPVDSLSRANASSEERSVWQGEVASARAVPWIQIRLSAETWLAPGSRLRMVSMAQPDFVVDVHARDLHWLEGVGYLIPHGFPGDRVSLELFAAPESIGNRVTIDHVLLGGRDDSLAEQVGRAPGEPVRTICDATDERVGLSQPTIGRLLDANRRGACSGFIVDCPGSADDKCLLSAGHCFVPGTGFHQVSAIVEFDVPLSAANCAINSPADPNKTFMIDPQSFPQNAVNAGPGNDWAVFRVFPNGAGRTAFEEQGDALSLANASPVVGASLDVIGFGLDAGGATPCSGASCSNQGQANQTLQTASGPFVGITGHRIEHRVDTCGGNSGSPITVGATGDVLGIHTHAGCTASGGANQGTATTLPALVTALATCKQARGLVLLDRTGSMLVPRPSTGNSRCADALALARQDVDSFFDVYPESEGARLAIWTFAESAPAQLSDFVGRSEAQAALAGLMPEGCAGSTPLAEALCATGDELIDGLPPLAHRTLMVSSDGGENNSSGACAGPSSASGPPFDPGSWQRKVTDQLRNQAVVQTRFWGSVTRDPIDPETGEATLGGASDLGFFENLAAVTGGSSVAVGDNDPLPPPFFGSGSGAVPIPALGPWGLLAIAVALALVAITKLRARG